MADYERHAAEMKPLIEEMQRSYGEQSHFRVGSGMWCCRAPPRLISEVALSVGRVRLDVPLSLWRSKVAVVQASLKAPLSCVSTEVRKHVPLVASRLIEHWLARRSSGIHAPVGEHKHKQESR